MVVGSRHVDRSWREGHGEGLGHHVVTAHRLQVAHHGVAADQHGHLFAQRRVPGSPLVLHRVLVHAHLEALPQAAGAALVAVCLVHLALAVGPRLARVLAIAADAALEEARTAVTRVDPVVLARAVVTAHFARRVVEDPAWRRRNE